MPINFWGLSRISADVQSSAKGSPDIKIVDVPAEVPQFKREYITTVGDGVIVTVQCWSYYFCTGPTRRVIGQLTQRDGKYLWFDPERVADKIIDRELSPLVQAAVDQILAIDRAYVTSSPSQFTDTRGVTWRRA